MVPTIQAETLSLYDVKTKFGLRPAEEESFFSEWVAELPEITKAEQQHLDRVKASYTNLAQYPMLENTVKMVILSPLLDLAGFYQPPFRITAEEPVQITAEDDSQIVRGRIDVLVLQQQFWVLAIESKSTRFAVMEAVPQALAYMIANPNPERPSFGLATNGTEFLFLKLTRPDAPRYALSNVFSLLNRGNQLYEVARILKRLADLMGT